MIVLDTTVLVYAKGAEHQLRDPCRRLIELIVDGSIAATTTVQAVQELVHVRARRRERDDAARLGAGYADLLAPLLTGGEQELRSGLALYVRHARLGAFDAVLAATAIAVGASHIVSADHAFALVSGVSHVFPDESGVQRLVSAGAPPTDR